MPGIFHDKLEYITRGFLRNFNQYSKVLMTFTPKARTTEIMRSKKMFCHSDIVLTVVSIISKVININNLSNLNHISYSLSLNKCFQADKTGLTSSFPLHLSLSLKEEFSVLSIKFKGSIIQAISAKLEHTLKDILNNKPYIISLITKELSTQSTPNHYLKFI